MGPVSFGLSDVPVRREGTCGQCGTSPPGRFAL